MAEVRPVTAVVVVASHRRSGTHLVLDSLRRNAVGVEPRFMTLERLDPAHPRHVTVAGFDRRLHRSSGTVLVKTHTLPGEPAWQDAEAREYARELLADAPTVVVHRDGRDVLVSLYHYVASYSRRVASQSFGEFIRDVDTSREAMGQTRAAYWQYHVLAWLDARPAVLVAYAEVLGNFRTAMAEIAEGLELQLGSNVEPVILAPQPTGLPALARRLRGASGSARPGMSTAIRPRSGGSGGWQTEFDADDLAWFEGTASDAMRRLGYGPPIGVTSTTESPARATRP